jgi:CheY-like chemotaxis protein
MLANNIGGAIRRNMSLEELKDMMELARSADKAKSNFLASMSHEIRTPMNGVIGMTSLLLQSDLTPSQRDYVQTIETSGDSLLNIINEILDFSKIESGHMVLEESPFDLRRCVEDVLDLMAPKIFEKKLELIYYIDPTINSYIFGDGFRLRQILVNLIGNAIKFTEKGEILVQVAISNQEGESVILEFSVKDSGIGIPSNKIEALFNPFTQVDASTTRKYGGSGLGLAISANLVKLMDGKIWVKSELGTGSDFKFTIKTCFSPPPENSNKSIEKLQLLHGKKVLIVDDNHTNRRILLLQFSFWNIESIAVTSGQEALDLLDGGEKFDVAILDMQMPDMDGEMLAREIRKRFSKSQLPLIMLTSIGFNIRTPEVKQLFSFYVNKPLKHSRLAEILLSVFMLENNEIRSKNDSELDLKNISEKFPFEILIAEDNFINQKLIRKLFEVLGYKTDLAANGYEVIDALKRKPYNIVFMDIQMPEMDGYEATRIIKERWGNKAPVIIAMTANAMQGDKEKCMFAGMDDYVSKPLRLEDLLRVINYWGEMKDCIYLGTN